MILWEFRGTLMTIFVIGLAIISWRRGADPERITASVLAAMAVIAWLYRYLAMAAPGGGYWDTNLAFALIDTLALAILFAVGMLSNRVYPLLMAGFQLTATGMHFVNEIAQEQAPLAYALLNVLPFYFMIASQMLGLWFHIRREKRLGPYPSWRSFFDPLPERGRKERRGDW